MNKFLKSYKLSLALIGGLVVLTSFFPNAIIGNNVKTIYANTDDMPTSPIKKVYAGSDFALFLHEDTTVTGFGSNKYNVLGMTGETNNNTGEWVNVSRGPTGYSHLKVNNDYAFGFRPDADNPYLFQGVRIREPLAKEENPFVGLIRDGDRSHYNSHNAVAYIGEDGHVYQKGTDYWTHIGIGQFNPLDRYPSGWIKSLAPLPSGYTHSAEFINDLQTEETIITNTFDITSPEIWDIRGAVSNQIDEKTNRSFCIKILNSDNTLAKNLGCLNLDGWSTREWRATGLSVGTYKLEVYSKNLKWNIKIYQDKKELSGATNIWYAASYGKFLVADSNNDYFLHWNGWGYVKKVEKPIGFDVLPKDIVAGYSEFAGIDSQGRLWKWSTGTPTLVNFSDIDGVPFYDKYNLVEVSLGSGFTMVISETKDPLKTRNVWSWGYNNHGKTALEETVCAVGATCNTPSIVTKNGIPLDGIQSIAAGSEFSVMVQNIENGQLVWTSGFNNSGQLGGGIQLSVGSPAIIPGLSDIEEIYPFITRTYVRAINSVGDTFEWGGSKSYPSKVTPLSNAMPAKKYSDFVYQYIIKNTDGSLWSTSSCCAVVSTSNYMVVNDAKFNDLKPLNELGNPIREFYNVKDVASHAHGGTLIDENGKLWTFGSSGGGANPLEQKFYYGWGTRTDYAVPGLFTDNTQVGDLEKLASGNNMVIALARDPLTGKGKVYGWGTHSYNGTGGSTNYVKPMHPSSSIHGEDIVKIDLGEYHSLALDAKGQVWSWGVNGDGRLGIGSTAAKSYPELISQSHFNDNKIVDIAAGQTHSLFLTETGDVYATGDNALGQLGNGTTVNSNIPIKVVNVSKIKKVSAGKGMSFAIDQNKRVWAWGYAGNGSLGNNFSISRTKPSTAIGNDLPEMIIKNDIETLYFSKYGKTNIQLSGTVTEHDAEKTKVYTSMLGVEKAFTIEDTDWTRDVYDEVESKNWTLDWNVNELPLDASFQGLTKIVSEDNRGGLIEQFFSGSFIIDNEAPIMPNWGDTCIINKKAVPNTQTCYSGQYFQQNGTNGVNDTVRIYMNPIQKIGENKAPVKIQMKYRKKQVYGYPVTWTDWIDVVDKNENGHYYDFFEGFLGESQIKVRAKDEAGNISAETADSRYVIIANAGGEIDKFTVVPLINENKLSTKLTFTGKTPSGSSIKTFGVNRKLSTAANWVNITPVRQTWVGAENVYVDDNNDLLGNAKYQYKLDAENTVGIGQPKISESFTNPYSPENFKKLPNDTGMSISISQDKRNTGTILYRIVLVDNLTGEIYSRDYSSSNKNEEIVYDLKDADIPFKIVNNSIKISLIVKGKNGIYHTIVYDENFINSPAISNDKTSPTVILSIPDSSKKISNIGNNKINFGLFASDNVTIPEDLEVQVSYNGADWYGLKDTSWVLNYWGNFKTSFNEFPVGTSAGKKLIYVRIRDEAGNVAFDYEDINVVEPITRNVDSSVTDSRPEYANVTFDETIHINSPKVSMSIPKSGNVTQVQFSFDGINWSPWEEVDDNFTKFITLPKGDGAVTVLTRYKNDSDTVTKVDVTKDIVNYMLDTTPPEIRLETKNGTYITKNSFVEIKVAMYDNFAEAGSVTLENVSENPDLGMVFNGTEVPTKTQSINSKTEYLFAFVGLDNGFNRIPLKITDKAGNSTYKTIRIYKKPSLQ